MKVVCTNAETYMHTETKDIYNTARFAAIDNAYSYIHVQCEKISF